MMRCVVVAVCEEIKYKYSQFSIRNADDGYADGIGRSEAYQQRPFGPANLKDRCPER